MEMSLEDLERRIRKEIDYLRYPQREWVPDRTHEGQPVANVLIVGGGQTGMSLAFGLQLERIGKVEVIDANGPAHAGPWVDFARMLTLRSPKYLTGPDLGMPSLTPRAWYEARYGAAAWADTGKIGRETWHEYLQWYRRVLGIPVRHNLRVTRIRPRGPYLAVDLDNGETRLARRVVLATGLEQGGIHIPEMVSANLPRERYAHTTEAIDFARLRGKRVGVLGAGASAFDNAATALEHGALSVDLCARREDLPRINPYRWMENVGFLAQFAELDEATRWRMARRIFELNQPPPQETVWRCRRHSGFALHTGCPWTAVGMREDAISVDTPQGGFSFDFVIVGTGFAIDLSKRAEITALAPLIATWRDRYEPPEGEQNAALAKFPYLGPDCQFRERLPGTAPYLHQIYDFTFAALPSTGLGGGNIGGIKYGVRRVVSGLTKSLFVEDAEAHYDSLMKYADHELIDLQGVPEGYEPPKAHADFLPAAMRT
jgi:cation diffusion facilitator CzcD-associated flavoprotein CzcO